MRVNTQRLKILINNVVDMLSWKFSFCYREPVPSEINSEIQIPEITEADVELPKSAQENSYRTRHDSILGLERSRRDIHATNHQNLETIIATQSWPSSWKRANITPLPKVELPKCKGDYRGISVTPVIARVFEKTVYRNHAQEAIE